MIYKIEGCLDQVKVKFTYARIKLCGRVNGDANLLYKALLL